MGNGHSTEALGPAQLDLISQSLARQGHDNLLAPFTSPSGEQCLGQDARQQIHARLFAPDDPVDQPLALSVPSEPQPMPRLDVATVIAIIEDLKKHASQEELLTLHRAVLSVTQDTPASTPSVESEKKMSRRRSFFTPGIATRDKKGKKSPPSKKAQTQTWSPDMFGQSPLSKIERMSASAVLGANLEASRPLTPDLSYLGAHKLGSLRVMNGVATPEPSVYGDRPQTALSTAGSNNEHYYSASEGSGRNSPEKGTLDTLEEHPSWQPDGCDTPKQSSFRTPGVLVEEVEQDMDVSFASSLQSDLSGVSYDVGDDDRLDTAPSHLRVDFSPLERPLSALKLYSFEASSNPFLVSPATEQHDGLSSDVHVPGRDSLQGHDDKQSYFNLGHINTPLDMTDDSDTESLSVPLRCPSRPPPPPPADIADDPAYEPHQEDSYFPNHDPQPELEISSKPPYEESVYSEYIAAPPVTEQRDSYHRLNSLQRLTGAREMRSSVLSASSSVYSTAPRGYATELPEEQFEPTKLQRSKVDSGYGSQTSVRTLQLAGDEKRLDDVQESPTPMTFEEEQRCDPGTPSGEACNQTTDTAQSALAPFQGERFYGPLPAVPPRSKSRPPPEQRFSTPNLLTMGSMSPVDPQKSIDTGSPQQQVTPKKLQKRRPVSCTPSAGPVMVQSSLFENTAYSSLPRVPSLIADRHRNRLSKTPGMEHLEHTFKSVAHSDSRESMSEAIETVSIRFPSPTRKHLASEDIQKPKLPTPDRGRKSNKSEGIADRKSYFSRSRKSRERRRSGSFSPEPEGESLVLAGVADFGTVAHSLGSSPYDLAMSEGAPRRSAEGELRDPRGLMHPHQLGTGMPRKKIGLDDKAAATLAMQRSRDLPAGLDMTNTHYLPSGSSNNARVRGRGSVEKLARPERQSVQLQPWPLRPAESSPAMPQRHIPDTARWDENDKALAEDPGSQTLRENRLRSPTRDENTSRHEAPEWEQSVKAWQTRRKSVGQYLAQPPPGRGGAAVGESMRQTSEGMHPLHLNSPTSPQRETTDFAARAASPTPSVLERAAAWERAQLNLETPQHAGAAPRAYDMAMPARPMRRAPSPPKLQQAYERTEPGRVAVSRFSAAASASRANLVARRERFYGQTLEAVKAQQL